MAHVSDQPPPPSASQRLRLLGQRFALVSLVLLFAAGALAVLLYPADPDPGGVTLAVGDVAPQDILAPRSITYVSSVLTDRARNAAAAAVPDVYDPPDTRVARQQVANAREVLEYITTVRADRLATREQQLADLAAIPDLTLPSDVAGLILALSDARWEAVKADVLKVIEQVMRDQLRADRLDEARRFIPALVSVNLNEDEAEVVVAIAQAHIAPNSFFNQAATEAAREAARQAVAPVSQSFVEGQAVILANRVVSAADLEALEQLGLREPQRRWQDLVSPTLAVALSLAFTSMYLRRFQPEIAVSPRYLILFGVLTLGFVVGAKLMIPGRTVLPYLYPAGALAMLLAVVIDPNVAVVFSIVVSVTVGVVSGGRLELVAYVGLGSIIGILALNRPERINSFLASGLAVSLTNAGVVLAFRLPDPATDTIGLATLVGAGLANGILSTSLTLVGFFILGSLFDLTTTLQLSELTRPNHPLLQRMLRQAPGSYQHSLQVANLAEQAAERIGANAMLVRVGALYHDIGKAQRPQFYVENQLDGSNIHARLDPATSAEMIIGHVKDGLDMARQHRLPSRVRAFIPEHHGTLLTRYQYTQAVQNAGGDASQVDEGAFRYPGPRPQSRETALLMLADGCEAKVRADRPTTVEEIDRIVKQVIDSRVAQGQLDDCHLTLRDLQTVRESFVSTLKGMLHARLQYPEETQPAHPLR